MEEKKVEEKKDQAVVTNTQIKPDAVKDDFSDVFISENDTFDIFIKYYKKDGKIIVEGVDDDFSSSEPCKSFIVTLKQPDQFDCARIASSSPRVNPDLEKFDVREFLAMEMSRFLVIVRKWSLGSKKLDNDAIMNMHPKIIKGILFKIRNQIGMDGIF